MEALNVLGKPLRKCCDSPLTGFYRDGFCHTGKNDFGTHVTCALMTQEFLPKDSEMIYQHQDQNLTFQD